MGLYNEKIEGLGKIKKDKLYMLIGAGAFITIILILLLIFAVDWSNITDGFKGSNLSLKFSKNPYTLNKDTDLKILTTIKNNSEIDSENASITIVPVENIFYITCENSETGNNKVVIPIIAKDATRTINCDVKVSPDITASEILAGTYSFDVVYSLNSENFKKRTKLTIKK
jgi:hypothetical protein